MLMNRLSINKCMHIYKNKPQVILFMKSLINFLSSPSFSKDPTLIKRRAENINHVLRSINYHTQNTKLHFRVLLLVSLIHSWVRRGQQLSQLDEFICTDHISDTQPRKTANCMGHHARAIHSGNSSFGPRTGSFQIKGVCGFFLFKLSKYSIYLCFHKLFFLFWTIVLPLWYSSPVQIEYSFTSITVLIPSLSLFSSLLR